MYDPVNRTYLYVLVVPDTIVLYYCYDTYSTLYLTSIYLELLVGRIEVLCPAGTRQISESGPYPTLRVKPYDDDRLPGYSRSY